MLDSPKLSWEIHALPTQSNGPAPISASASSSTLKLQDICTSNMFYWSHSKLLPNNLTIQTYTSSKLKEVLDKWCHQKKSIPKIVSHISSKNWVSCFNIQEILKHHPINSPQLHLLIFIFPSSTFTPLALWVVRPHHLGRQSFQHLGQSGFGMSKWWIFFVFHQVLR